jgi:hypothetical protein
MSSVAFEFGSAIMKKNYDVLDTISIAMHYRISSPVSSGIDLQRISDLMLHRFTSRGCCCPVALPTDEQPRGIAAQMRI